ncbi:MAG: helicase, partial [Selenomonas sp.]|nr:helicase [Selenomonas sp.]
QRVGRINRVGTAHAEIFVYNFFPTAQASAQLPLTDRILEKLQAFHDTMGDDYKFLSDEEDPSPHKLFRDISQDLSEEETSNPELAYLAEIRAIRDGDPQLFQTIKRLPRKSKTGRASETVEEESVLTFVRKGALKSFFLAGKREARGLTFLEAMNLLACGPDESRQPVGAAYYELYKANDAAFDASLEAEDVIAPQHAALRGNDKTIQRVLKAALACGQLTDEEEALAARILAAIENGDIPQRVTKDIVKSLKAAKDPVAAFAVIRGGIDETYLHARDEAVLPQGGTKEVILSCFLQPS